MELAGAEFMGVWANDQSFVAGHEAASEFDGFAEVGLAVVGIFVGEDEGVGGDDVFLGEDDVESAGDEVGKADARFDQGEDGVQVGSGHAVAGGDGSEEEFHSKGSLQLMEKKNITQRSPGAQRARRREKRKGR